MAFLASVFCCISNAHSQEGPKPSSTQHQPPHIPGMMAGPITGNVGNVVDDPYGPCAPLPAYTPRAFDVNDEKPPAFEDLSFSTHLRLSEYPVDEKTPLDFQVNQARTKVSDDHSSDASSAFSVPSSLGNTSTATSETPPPPYSIQSSRAASRRSMSICTSATAMTQANDVLLSPVTQPQPVLHRPDGAAAPPQPIPQQWSWQPTADCPFPPTAYSGP
ncbi:hypothetical protein LOZ65_002516 [Ophidiomyces ophidiicola]|nr:hypothetical protein LOZ65_002516 [Ophidiomyces ophidiicola]